jgi:hypothetical protein
MKIPYRLRYRCTKCPHGKPVEFGSKNRIFCNLKQTWVSKIEKCEIRDNRECGK